VLTTSKNLFISVIVIVYVCFFFVVRKEIKKKNAEEKEIKVQKKTVQQNTDGRK